MFNPRLASGDVGVGLSIRRMRENFLSRFTTTYSLRPIADVGSVFRRYPGMWQVGRRVELAGLGERRSKWQASATWQRSLVGHVACTLRTPSLMC